MLRKEDSIKIRVPRQTTSLNINPSNAMLEADVALIKEMISVA